jgi:hypothetical protein
MRIRMNYITPLLVAGAAAAAIAAAPAAASPAACVTAGGPTQCQTPGNVAINTAPSPQSGRVDPYIGSTYGRFFTYNQR